MFAVVRTGGKQYRVSADDKIIVERLAGDIGDEVALEALMTGEGGSIGMADGQSVTARIVDQNKGDKVIIFKKRRRHNYRRKRGHRQLQTVLQIVSLGAPAA